MPILSRRGRLAIAAVVDVALHARKAPVTAKSLADRHNLPPRHLEPMLQALVGNGILRGTRGPRGGYSVAKPCSAITCGEIIRAAIDIADRDLEHLSPLVTTVVSPALESAERQYFAALDALTLDDLCREAETSHVA